MHAFRQVISSIAIFLLIFLSTDGIKTLSYLISNTTEPKRIISNLLVMLAVVVLVTMFTFMIVNKDIIKNFSSVFLTSISLIGIALIASIEYHATVIIICVIWLGITLLTRIKIPKSGSDFFENN